jgi:hypothetical protein
MHRVRASAANISAVRKPNSKDQQGVNTSRLEHMLPAIGAAG